MEASGCRVIRYGKEDAEFSIYDVADIHYLNRGISKTHFFNDIYRIKKDPYALFFLGGDYGDWIYPGDPRCDWEAFDQELKVVDLAYLGSIIAKFIIQSIEPIKNKCLGLCIGNHEFTAITRSSQARVHEEICFALGVPNMRFSGFADIYFVHDDSVKWPVMETCDKPPIKFTSRLRCFIHHGMGAANTAGGKINKLKALVDMVDADLVLMGHCHEQFAKAFLRLSPNINCTEIQQKVTMGLITGSYLRTYAPGFTSYGEIKGYSPTTLGATRARYMPKDRILTVENRADNVGIGGNG